MEPSSPGPKSETDSNSPLRVTLQRCPSNAKLDKKTIDKTWRRIFDPETQEFTEQGLRICDKVGIDPSEMVARSYK